MQQGSYKQAARRFFRCSRVEPSRHQGKRGVASWVRRVWVCTLAVLTSLPTLATAAQTNSTATAATNVAAIATTEIVGQSESTLSSLRAIESEARSDPGVAVVEQQLPAVTEEIGARSEENARILSHSSSLDLFGRLESSWQGLEEELGEWNRSLMRHAKELQQNSAHLQQIARSWQLTRDSQKQEELPPELTNRLASVLAETKRAHDEVTQQLSAVLTLQNRVSEQQTRVGEALNAIDQARRQIIRHLFVRDSPALWSKEARNTSPQAVTTQSQNSLTRQWKELRWYCVRKRERFFIQGLLILGLATMLTRAHRKLAIRSLTNEALEPSARSLGTPVASGLLIALLFSPWIYAQAPRLLWSILGAVALPPAIVVLRRLLFAHLHGVLNVLACFYLLDQCRTVAAAQPTLWRLLFLAEMCAALIYCLVLLERGKANNRASPLMLTGLRLGAAVFALVIVASVFGYGRLSSLLGNITLSGAYLALILYAATRIADAMLRVLLTVSPAARLAMVRRHADLLTLWIGRLLQWLAVGAWIVYLLQKLALRRAALLALETAVRQRVVLGTLNFTIGHVLLFAAVLWAAFLISRFVRFVLEEEIYPHMRMAPGLHYSISRTLHYAILLIGFLIALAMLGINLTKLTILAGAFGVGLGFGMQNIVNNFVSGIILLFERPVKVGDVIQLEETEGVVQRIGIRASIVRTSCGSEIIVPNAKLISDPVTNWTFSQRRRLITMPIAVASDNEPKRVIDVLRQAAGSHPQVAKDGTVQALLTNLNNGTANYELRAWTDQSENWEQVRSDLFVLVKSTLKAEGIPMH